MTKRIIAAAVAALVAGSLAACSAPAESASPASPAMTQAAAAATPRPSAPATPSPSATASPSASAAAAKSPFERASEVVASLIKGDKEGAAKNMTQPGADAMSAHDVRDYMSYGRTVTGCHISDHELTLLPKITSFGVDVFSSGLNYKYNNAKATAVRVDCAEATIAVVVGTIGPMHDVDGMKGYPFPDDRYFAGS